MRKLPKSIPAFISIFVKKQWKIFTLITLAAIISTLANNTIWPLITGSLIDAFGGLNPNTDNPFDKLFKPLVVAMFFWVFMEFLQRGKGFLLAYSMPIFQASIRMFTFDYISHHSHTYFANKYIGALAYRIDDLPRSAKLIVDDVLTVFLPLIISVFCSAGILFQMHPKLSIIFLIWLMTYMILAYIFAQYSIRYSSIQSAARAVVQGGIVDSVRNHLSIKIYNGIEYEKKLMQSFQDDEVRKSRFSLCYIEKSKVVLSLVNTMGIGILFYSSIVMWQLGDVTIGNLTFIVSSTLSILTMLWFAADEMSYVFNEMGICDQSLKIIQDPIDIYDNQDSADLKISNGKIEFKNVSFRYSTTQDYILDNFSLTIEPGSKVGLVGFSGSGKTTFINLIMRLYNVEKGSILIDNQDINLVKLESLRKNIALIQQEPILFHRTVIDNIRFGNLDATDEDVIFAATKAHCVDFIDKMVDKYDTIVGETGSKLSGGQRQRVAIARAILKDPPILIMDEGTASLDTETEQSIQKSMDSVIEGKTAIIIAHRLSTLLRVDRILVFHDGMIVEDDTHEGLLKKGGYYARLWSMQNNIS